ARLLAPPTQQQGGRDQPAVAAHQEQRGQRDGPARERDVAQHEHREAQAEKEAVQASPAEPQICLDRAPWPFSTDRSACCHDFPPMRSAHERPMTPDSIRPGSSALSGPATVLQGPGTNDPSEDRVWCRRLPEAPTYYPLPAGRGSRFLGQPALLEPR